MKKEIKQKSVSIYLTEEEKNKINKIGIGRSFSDKCKFIINQGFEQISQKENDNVIRFIDLFAGLGGIRIGFENALSKNNIKTKCVFSSEIKESAINAYSCYFKEKNIHGDITKIKSDEIPEFDFLLAGFPCQPFSFAGNRKGFKDTRGTLFFEIERILRDKKPAGFILENVEGLVKHDSGNTLRTIISSLKSLGYHVEYDVLNSKDFGLAQERKRIYIIGLLDNIYEPINLNNHNKTQQTFIQIQEFNLPTINNRFTKSLFSHYSVNELYGKSIKDKRGGHNNIHSWELELKGSISELQKQLLNTLLKERRKKKWAIEIGIPWMDGMPLTTNQIYTFDIYKDIKKLQQDLDDLVNKGYLKYEHPKTIENGKRIYDKTKQQGYNIVTGKLSFEFTKIIDPNSITPTLVATDVHKIGIIDNGGIRKLSIREGLRLFGFPETYSLDHIPYNKAMDLLGNTVCIPVIESISNKIAEIINHYDTVSLFKNEYKEKNR